MRAKYGTTYLITATMNIQLGRHGDAADQPENRQQRVKRQRDDRMADKTLVDTARDEVYQA